MRGCDSREHVSIRNQNWFRSTNNFQIFACKKSRSPAMSMPACRRSTLALIPNAGVRLPCATVNHWPHWPRVHSFIRASRTLFELQCFSSHSPFQRHLHNWDCQKRLPKNWKWFWCSFYFVPFFNRRFWMLDSIDSCVRRIRISDRFANDDIGCMQSGLGTISGQWTIIGRLLNRSRQRNDGQTTKGSLSQQAKIFLNYFFL